jgi:hypothetical protein
VAALTVFFAVGDDETRYHIQSSLHWFSPAKSEASHSSALAQSDDADHLGLIGAEHVMTKADPDTASYSLERHNPLLQPKARRSS